MKYNYDQFLNEMRRRGMEGQFSQSDLNLARMNPEAGMSILGYKSDYANAKTAEARALANAGAERIRNTYGNYTAGTDGSGFYLGNPRPINYGASSAPTYSNRYDDKIQSLLSELENRPDFSYDVESDDLYSQYRKQYAREGQRAQADALGAISAASGGIPSSYAATATSQAGDYYASKMTDKIPELYQQAYNRYLDEYRQKANTLSAYQNAERADFDRYQVGLNQYNQDRNFGYGQYLDDISHQRNEEALAYQRALDQASAGDYRGLENYGFDTSNHPAEFERRLALAKLGASVGDYSGLSGLGVNTSRADTFLAPRVGGSGRGRSRQEAAEEDVDTAVGIEGIIARAEKNGGVVTDEAEWRMLVEAYGEEELINAGYRFERGAGLRGLSPHLSNLRFLPGGTKRIADQLAKPKVPQGAKGLLNTFLGK